MQFNGLPSNHGISLCSWNGVSPRPALARCDGLPQECSNCSASASDCIAGFGSFIGGRPALNSSIGTTLKFSLSAGDRVTFNTLFEVVSADTNPVPVPAAVWLLGSALLGLAGASRRRRS
ncbi:MAG: VPLPA-CTERM sorting domain-containing protein [Gammaproteobacteria bacterium]